MSSINYLENKQIFVYEIVANPDQDSLLSIRDMNKLTPVEKNCFGI